MRVSLVSSAWPPVRCGVGDYTALLAAALAAEGVEVERFGAEPTPFNTLAAPAAGRRLAAGGADVVHVQYPAVGYNRSGLPSLLPLLLRRRARVVVTLHEFSIFRPYRWPWFAPFAYAADAVVFTNAHERDAFRRRMPAARARTAIIPIGSNIPRGAPAMRDPRSLCYFGLLMPGKGIEEFLELVALLRPADPPWHAALIGAVAEGCDGYAAGVLGRARALGVRCEIGHKAAAVGDLLQGVAFAYLPGPGGITERRGAVLAAIENGVQVIGPTSSATSEALRARVVEAASPAQARAALERGLPPPGDSRTMFGWDAIARSHVALYRALPGRPLAR